MAGSVSVTDALRRASPKATKGAPRSKRSGANNSPARQRYWASRRLEERKIRNLMRHNGLTRAEAYLRWHNTRQGRVRK